MHRPLSVLVGAVVAGLVLVGCAASPNAQPNGDAAEQPSELVFAVVPTDDSAELQKAWLPVAAIIEDATGIPTTIQAVSSNSGVIEAQVAERADIAAYGAFSYYLASGVADVVPVAMDQRTPEPGSGAVQSYGVVNADSDITSIEDVKGADVCFTDPASTTGYLGAAAALQAAGIDPESDLNPIFVGSHDVAVTQMLAGDCEVAFVASTFIDVILPARGVFEEGDVSTIWASDPIPGTPIVLGNWLSEELRAQITEVLTTTNAMEAYEAGFCDTETREAPEDWGPDHAGKTGCLWGGTQAFAFEPADDATYAVIADICAAVETDACLGNE